MSCKEDIGGSCGGLAKPWDTLCVTKSECCEKKLTSIGVPFYEEQLFRDSCLASCHSPTPAPANTSSKNPSTNPSSNQSEITINVSINECPCKDLKRIPDRCEVDILIDMLESHVLADRKLASQWTRAAFHDAGTFDVGIPEGGANGCLLNHPPMRYVDIDQTDLYLDSPLTHAFNTILQAASKRRIVFCILLYSPLKGLRTPGTRTTRLASKFRRLIFSNLLSFSRPHVRRTSPSPSSPPLHQHPFSSAKLSRMTSNGVVQMNRSVILRGLIIFPVSTLRPIQRVPAPFLVVALLLVMR